MRQATQQFEFSTRGTGVLEITPEVERWVRSCDMHTGVLTLHVRHTSASLMIQENADPQVMRDMETFLQQLVPYGSPMFRHTAEGPDDMPAHVRSALTHTTLSIPVIDGGMALGTWQGIFLYEHRKRPHRRRVVAHLLGE